MKIFQRLVKTISSRAVNQKTFSVEEVRELIAKREFAQAREAVEHLSMLVNRREVEQQCLLGEINYQEGNDAEAQALFEAALAVVPGKPSAHLGLSLVMAEKGDLASAYRHAFFAYSVDGNNPRFLAQLGYCQILLRNYPAAERPLRRATLLAPENAYSWNNLGIVLKAKRKLMEARVCFLKASRLRPDYKTASDNLALIEQDIANVPTSDLRNEKSDSLSQLHCEAVEEFPKVIQLGQQGETQQAIDLCEKLALEHPDSVTLAVALNILYQRAGDLAAGVEALEVFLMSHSNSIEALNALGLAKLDLLEPAAAGSYFEQVLSQHPESFDALCGMARALTAQDRFADATEWIDKALALNPNDLSMRSAKAINFINRCQYEEGLALCKALEAEGCEVFALGGVLAYLGRFDEAIKALDTQLQSHPHDPGLHFHRGSIRLLNLDFKGGWEDYQYRAYNAQEQFRVLPFPIWRGEPLNDKKIVVLAEQGLGDQVMFSSCIPDLLRLNPKEVVVEIVDRIAPTIQRSFPEVRVIVSNQSRAVEWVSQCPDMDYYVPLGDLPRYFRNALEDFPNRSSFLVANPDRIRYWRQKLEIYGPGPYIGVSWKGGTESTRSVIRTVSPDTLSPLGKAVEATWVCLQYGPVQEAVQQSGVNGFPMAYWPESISDLDEFAALISALDMVITVCNTTVHYAGALGKPVWVIAPKIPEWRYGLKNPILPWYPSSLMWRQSEHGDWENVVADVCKALRTKFVSGVTGG
jgi:tetratricopeptide (TPR) repeat protein